ncbi:hypothetical protein Xoosp13_341 [Xanthomonas phage Xoo-sp13]|nr:hypothetical protein Xoosp13_341 [Xanthomonas phage Xoo-sp13]
MKTNKKDLALALYAKNHDLPRPQLIELVMAELNTTENCARTHISNAAKSLSASLGKEYKTRQTNKSNLKKEKARELVLHNYVNMSRKDLAEKLVKDLGVKSPNSAQTHISRIIKENKIQLQATKQVCP